MRPEGGCSYKKHPDYRHHRMHYCGVCKAMGNSYGHKTRFLLNYDIVFLAEILSELAAEDLSQWGGAYQAINQCFTMPKGETPISLQYAADANLLLSELKIQDHIADTGRLSWRFAGWWFNTAFAKAAKQLEKWGADSTEIQYWSNLQAERESAAIPPEADLADYLWSVAAPTAQLTSLVFRQGAYAVGKPEQADAMAELGLQFGYLAYLLDAFEDVEKDAYGRQFNPLLRYYEAERSLSEAQFEAVRMLIETVQTSIAAPLSTILATPDRIDLYTSRLRSNVAMQIYRERVIPLNLHERLAKRWQAAKNYAQEMTCTSTAWTAKLRYHLLSVAVFIAPRTPEYMGMSSKEMAVFTWAAFLTAFLAAIGLGFAMGQGRNKKKKKPRQEKRSMKRFFNKLRRTFASRNNCWEACCAACCTACACACCEACCQNGCNSCCDSCCDGNSNAWIWLLVAFGIVVIGVTVLLVILL